MPRKVGAMDGPYAAGRKRRQLSQDIIGVFGSRTAVALFGTVTGIILARKLGPHDRGILALMLLLPATLVTVTNFGITEANVCWVRRGGRRSSRRYRSPRRPDGGWRHNCRLWCVMPPFADGLECC